MPYTNRSEINYLFLVKLNIPLLGISVGFKIISARPLRPYHITKSKPGLYSNGVGPTIADVLESFVS